MSSGHLRGWKEESIAMESGRSILTRKVRKGGKRSGEGESNEQEENETEKWMKGE